MRSDQWAAVSSRTRLVPNPKVWVPVPAIAPRPVSRTLPALTLKVPDQGLGWVSVIVPVPFLVTALEPSIWPLTVQSNPLVLKLDPKISWRFLAVVQLPRLNKAAAGSGLK